MTTTEAFSGVVSPEEARRRVKAHTGIIEVEVNMIHDMVSVRTSKSEAYRLIDMAKDGGFNVHVIGVGNRTIVLVFTDGPVDTP